MYSPCYLYASISVYACYMHSSNALTHVSKYSVYFFSGSNMFSHVSENIW